MASQRHSWLLRETRRYRPLGVRGLVYGSLRGRDERGPDRGATR